MKISVEIFELENDNFEEELKKIFPFEVDPIDTVIDLKKKIEDKEGWDPDDQFLFTSMFPLYNNSMILGDYLNEGDTVTVVTKDRSLRESTKSNIKADPSNDIIFITTGTTEHFKIIPLNRRIPEQQIKKSFLSKYFSFGVCIGQPTTGSDGKMILRCNIYKADAEAVEITIDAKQDVFQTRQGISLPEKLFPKETKTFNESENIKGFLRQWMKDVLTLVGVVGQAGAALAGVPVPK